MSTLIPTEQVSIISDMNNTTEQVELVQTCQITFTVPIECVEKVGKYVKNVLSSYHKDCAGNLSRNTKETTKKSTMDSTTTKQKKKDSPSRAKRRLKRQELKGQLTEEVNENSEADKCPIQKSESSETDSSATPPLPEEGCATQEELNKILEELHCPLLNKSSSCESAAEDKHIKVNSDTEKVLEIPQKLNAAKASLPDLKDHLKHLCDLINEDESYMLINCRSKVERKYLSDKIANDSKLYDLFKLRLHHPKTVDEHIKLHGGRTFSPGCHLEEKQMFTFYNVIKYITQNSELACDYAPIDLHQLFDLCRKEDIKVAVNNERMYNDF